MDSAFKCDLFDNTKSIRCCVSTSLDSPYTYLKQMCVFVCVSIFISQLESFKMHTDDKTITRINLVALFIAVINNISMQVYILNVCVL